MIGGQSSLKAIPCPGRYFGKYDAEVIHSLCSKEGIDFENNNLLIHLCSRNIEKPYLNSSSVAPNAILSCTVRDSLCSKGLQSEETP